MEPPPHDWEKNYKTRPLAAKDWDEQRDIFTRLYHTENLDLTEVRRIMAEQHGFFANSKQCKSVTKKWKLEKNLKKTKTMAILKIQDRRALEGKATDFGFHGQLVNEQNLVRARKRYRGDGEKPAWLELRSPVATPSHVEYWTPKSLPSGTPGYKLSTGREWDFPLSHGGDDEPTTRWTLSPSGDGDGRVDIGLGASGHGGQAGVDEIAMGDYYVLQHWWNAPHPSTEDGYHPLEYIPRDTTDYYQIGIGAYTPHLSATDDYGSREYISQDPYSGNTHYLWLSSHIPGDMGIDFLDFAE